MKCFILAGGCGDRLWPLSRKNYPKQFMEIRENRSMFQETIARNLPFCEEFYIITNSQYRYIVEGQLQVFQGLKFRIFLEESFLKTAPPVTLACMCCSPSEQILLVSTDHIIEGGNYKNAIIKAQKNLKEGKISVLGVEANLPHIGYGYIKCKEDKVVEFRGHATEIMAKYFVEQGNYYWDTGVMVFSAGDYLHETKLYAPELIEHCKEVYQTLDLKGRIISLHEEETKMITPISIGDAVSEYSDKLYMVETDFYWNRIMNLESLAIYENKKKSSHYIEENCINTSVMNYSSKHMLILNDLKDVTVVNTDDAIFISNKDSVGNIKSIMKDHYQEAKPVFEESNRFYESWGIKEILSEANGYKVKKIIIFPGKKLPFHKHHLRSEHWAVVSGTATICIHDTVKDYGAGESVLIVTDSLHEIINQTIEDVIVIETSVGAHMGQQDFFPWGESKVDKLEPIFNQEEIIKLEPIFKDYLWGGKRLREEYGKNCDYDVIAESWELSTHNAGQSIIAKGRYKGYPFGEYLERIGKERLGWKSELFEKFPLLIKFIDAEKSLSIQVHPQDEYALPVENEYGKNEMWYILDANPDAYVYLGFSKDISKEEIRLRVQNHSLEEILNKVPVKKGETYFVEAGTVHAIGPGSLICEIQQNSNATYRLYDYGRCDKYGELRELHLEKALDVIDIKAKTSIVKKTIEIEKKEGYSKELLGECKYFSTSIYTVETKVVLLMEQSSFVSVIVIEGNGVIGTHNIEMEFTLGESYFIPAGKKNITITGKCKILVTQV